MEGSSVQPSACANAGKLWSAVALSECYTCISTSALSHPQSRKLTAGVVAGHALSDLDKTLRPWIPTQCNSLTLDAYFARLIGDHIELSSSLQNLVIDYGDRPTHRSGIEPLTALPDLRDLTQLRSLKVQAHDSCRDALANSLAKCPESLTSCSIEGWGIAISFLPEVYQVYPWPVQENLRRLTKLELCFCRVRIPEGCITGLEGLTSLIITRSEIAPELDEVVRLTNLVSLDLSDTWPPGGIYGHLKI